MATTLVPNPNDTQPQRPRNQGLIASAQAQPRTMAAPATQQQGAATPAVQPAYTSERPEVRSQETTQGQLASILSGDSPIMQRARSIAAQQSNSRGLLNSSMGAEAGTAAMIDRAAPIANADAGVYDSRARFNADAANTALGHGANIAAQMRLQQGQQDFQRGESALDRGHQTALQEGQHAFQRGESVLDRAERTELQKLQQAFQSGENVLDRAQQQRLQELQQKFQGEESVLDRDQQKTLQQMQIDAQKQAQEVQHKWQEVQAQLDRDQQTEITELQASLQEGINKNSLPQQFAMSLAGNTQNAIQAVLANGDLTPESKRIAVANIIDAANSQMRWASAFYDTPLPDLNQPGAGATLTPSAPIVPRTPPYYPYPPGQVPP